jgi:tRNA-specific 2-thiouridylase
LSGGPWFVIKKDINRNIIYVSKGYNTQYQYGHEVNLSGFQFITKDVWGEFDDEKDITFKIRHTPEFTKGRISRQGDLYKIVSDEKIQGIAAGQFGVVYDTNEDICLASGMII